MSKGYRTDKAGNVLDYFDLPSKPEDTDEFTWIESDEKPPLYVPPPTVEQRIADLQALLAAEDWKVTRQTEQNTMPTEEWEAFKAKRQGYRDQIDLLRQEA